MKNFYHSNAILKKYYNILKKNKEIDEKFN